MATKLTVTTANFGKMLGNFRSTMKRVKEQSHQLAVFSLNHAQQNGDCIYLNAFWEELTPGMQAAFRRYAFSMTAEDLSDYNSSWLTIEQKQWVINPDMKGKPRKAYFRKKGEKTVELKTAEELIEFDSFHYIDPDTVKNPFTDENIIQTIHRLATRVDKEDAKVTDEMKAMVKRFESQVTKYAESRGQTAHEGNAMEAAA